VDLHLVLFNRKVCEDLRKVRNERG